MIFVPIHQTKNWWVGKGASYNCANLNMLRTGIFLENEDCVVRDHLLCKVTLFQLHTVLLFDLVYNNDSRSRLCKITW